MTHDAYFEELNRLLARTPGAAEAVSYYTEYTEDALSSGKSWEEVEQALGAPRDIAAKIKADISLDHAKQKPSVSNGMKALVAVLGVLASPVALPVAFALLAVIFALVVVAFSLVLGLFGAELGILAGLGIAISMAVSHIPTAPAAGFGLLGMILIAGGILLMLLYGTACLTGWIVSLIARAIRKMTEKTKTKMAEKANKKKAVSINGGNEL